VIVRVLNRSYEISRSWASVTRACLNNFGISHLFFVGLSRYPRPLLRKLTTRQWQSHNIPVCPGRMLETNRIFPLYLLVTDRFHTSYSNERQVVWQNFKPKRSDRTPAINECAASSELTVRSELGHNSRRSRRHTANHAVHAPFFTKIRHIGHSTSRTRHKRTKSEVKIRSTNLRDPSKLKCRIGIVPQVPTFSVSLYTDGAARSYFRSCDRWKLSGALPVTPMFCLWWLLFRLNGLSVGQLGGVGKLIEG
jgi:hypothetical protein